MRDVFSNYFDMFLNIKSCNSTCLAYWGNSLEHQVVECRQQESILS